MRSGGNRVKKSLEARSCFPNRKQQIHITISLSYFADTETPSRWEKLMISNGLLPTSMQTPGRKGWWCRLLLISPTTKQKNVHQLITPSFNNYYKTSHYLLQVGTCGFDSISPLSPPLPGKVIKLAFSTSLKTLVSEIQFSPMVQRRWAFSIRSDIVGWYGSSVFNLGGNFILFVLVTTLSNIPTHSTWGFPFLHILTLLFVVFLVIVILTGVRFYLISIWFGFPRWLVILRIFVSVGYLYVFSGKLSIQWLCPLLKSSYLGFAPPKVELYEFFI